MKSVITVLVLAATLAAGLVASDPAFAGGRYHGHYYHGPRVGVSIGYGWGPGAYWGSYWGPRYWYPPPAYYYPPSAYYYPPPAYYPPAVAMPYSPPVYVERDDAAAASPAPQPAQWWYFCRSVNTYYPYVKECAEGWQRVAPQPPPR